MNTLEHHSPHLDLGYVHALLFTPAGPHELHVWPLASDAPMSLRTDLPADPIGPFRVCARNAFFPLQVLLAVSLFPYVFTRILLEGRCYLPYNQQCCLQFCAIACCFLANYSHLVALCAAYTVHQWMTVV